MLKVIQPSLSIIRPFSGHPPMLKVIQPPLSIIHPFSRSSTHSAGHPAIPKYHPPIQHFIQEFLNYFLYSFKSHSEFAWSSCHFKAKVILPRLLEKLNFLRSVCPPNFTIGNTLTVNTLTLKCLANIRETYSMYYRHTVHSQIDFSFLQAQMTILGTFLTISVMASDSLRLRLLLNKFDFFKEYSRFLMI